jgi:SAM-dependent methyltransferase
LGIDSGNVALIMALGDLDLNQRNYAEALAGYRRAVDRAPRLAAAYAGCALALKLLGKYEEAGTEAGLALRLDPANAIALKVMARLHLDAREIPAARECCARVLAAHPTDRDALALRQECLSVQSTLGPDGLFGSFAERTRTWQELGPEHILQQLVVGVEPRRTIIRQRPSPQPMGADGLALPPADLTMGYGAGDLDYYLRLGRQSHEHLLGFLDRHQVSLDAGDAMLDWGCASGRVLRFFTEEARRGCEVWGGDVHAPSIEWARAHLSPPFRFFNCSSLPHLPFPDGTFKFIYALSVMTHIVALRDLWLLEIKRVLQPGGCAVLTIHDENTWQCFARNGMPDWMPRELRTETHLPGECVDIQGSTWDQTYTFFHSDYVRRAWGQYFRVAEIAPEADCYQAAVVLRRE